MAPRRKSKAASAKLAAYKKVKKELEKKLKELAALEAKSRKLKLDVVRLEVKLLTRQSPNRECVLGK